jgi:hypothetical protein
MTRACALRFAEQRGAVLQFTSNPMSGYCRKPRGKPKRVIGGRSQSSHRPLPRAVCAVRDAPVTVDRPAP